MISERTAVAVMSCCTVFCAHASMAPNPPHHNTTFYEAGSLINHLPQILDVGCRFQGIENLW